MKQLIHDTTQKQLFCPQRMPVGTGRARLDTLLMLRVQGVLTPFDCLDGFERRVQPRAAPAPQSAAARSAGQASTSGDFLSF